MALDTQAIKILIFDMDDTLLDTYGQLVKPATFEASAAMIRAGLDAHVDQCIKVRADLAVTRPRTNIYNELVQHFGVVAGADPQEVARAGFEAFHDREIKETILPFTDALRTLTQLGENYSLYLVTLGAPNTQKKKVKLLKIESFFKEIFFVDLAQEKNKAKAFKVILQKYPELKAPSFVSIGNRIDSDIKDAKELGMQTILMEHGEYLHLRPITAAEEPDHRVRRLDDLLTALPRASR